MPYRKVFFANGEFYHIFNRSLYQRPIFQNKRETSIFLRAMKYYLAPQPPVKFSFYRQASQKYQVDLSDPLVKIIAYCLMPTHFHFLLLQNKEKGIKTYLQRLINSYSHYFNLRQGQKGPLFVGPFKAVRVESDEQLLHLSRYIHLNPVSEYLVEEPQDYPYSSFAAYLGEKSLVPIETTVVLSHFSSFRQYQQFVLARKDYQRRLQEIKHLLFE